MTTTTTRLLRRAAVLCCAAATLLTGLVPAAYADAPAGTQSALAGQYATLSGGLLSLYAAESHQTLADYLASQKILLAVPPLTDPSNPAAPSTAPSTSPSAMPTGSGATPAPSVTVSPASTAGIGLLGTAGSLGAAGVTGTPLVAGSIQQLNQELIASGATIDTSKFTSFASLENSLAAKSHTLDGQVTLAGARWMSELATLHTAALTAPQSQTPSMPGIPAAALVFGLFANKSLTQLVNDSPNLFAAASKTGVGSAALNTAWASAMTKAYANSSGDLTKALPDPCTGSMLATMATGKPTATSGCSPACATGGLYLNAQAQSLFDPAASSTVPNPFASLWNNATFNGLQTWQQKQTVQQNPQLTQQMLAANAGSPAAACSAASSAATVTLGSSLPGIFAHLRAGN